MKRLVVLSDTHISYGGIPGNLYKLILDLKPDLIVHAGDIVIPDVIIELEVISEVVAVKGNMDIGLSLPVARLIEVEGLKIGIAHPGGPPREIEERLKRLFLDKKVNIIIYGHTHKASIEEKDGILFFNPGSAGDKIFTQENSIGFLVLDQGKILEKKIISLPSV